MNRKSNVSIKQYDYDVQDNHTRGSAEVSSVVVGGPGKNYVRLGAATIKQRVAEEFGGKEDTRISHGTLQNLRIKNILPHRKIGGLSGKCLRYTCQRMAGGKSNMTYTRVFEKFGGKLPEHMAYVSPLLALKCIGKDGSHVGSLNVSDVVVGFEQPEEVINQIYGGKNERLAQSAKDYPKKK